MNIYQAASEGNLPVCVLIWGLGVAKRVNLMAADDQGSNPMHYAAMADNTEVLGFLNQQTKGVMPFTDIRLVDTKNLAGETPLLKSVMHGKIAVAKVRHLR